MPIRQDERNGKIPDKRGAHERVLAEARHGSEYDVQFSDLKKEYAFGAVFDSAQVRHAYTPGVLRLKFE